MTPTPSPSSPLDPKELDEALVTAISCLDNTGFNESADTLRQFMANRTPTTQQGADPGQPAADRFIHGFAYALANLVRLHGDATEARDLWKESGYKRKDFETAGVDEYDMETLRGLEWLK